MQARTELGQGYEECRRVDLQKDRRAAFAVNAAAVVVMAALIAFANFLIRPLTGFFSADADGTLFEWLAKPLALIFGLIAYLILHELTHAAAMKLLGAHKVRFGFTGLYAFAGAEHDYFDKAAYITTALAPLALWGIVFTIAMILAPVDWFWVLYFLQIANISGAIEDVYVSFVTARMPSDVLVRDTGVDMTFYTKHGE